MLNQRPVLGLILCMLPQTHEQMPSLCIHVHASALMSLAFFTFDSCPSCPAAPRPHPAATLPLLPLPLQVRDETDLYLRQLEAEGRAEQVYGKGVQLVVPTEAFVFKTKNKASGEKVFINVCESDKVRAWLAGWAGGVHGHTPLFMNRDILGLFTRWACTLPPHPCMLCPWVLMFLADHGGLHLHIRQQTKRCVPDQGVVHAPALFMCPLPLLLLM